MKTGLRLTDAMQRRNRGCLMLLKFPFFPSEFSVTLAKTGLWSRAAHQKYNVYIIYDNFNIHAHKPYKLHEYTKHCLFMEYVNEKLKIFSLFASLNKYIHILLCIYNSIIIITNYIWSNKNSNHGIYIVWRNLILSETERYYRDNN